MGLDMLSLGVKTVNLELERYDLGVGMGKSARVRGFFELEEFELGRQLLMLKHRHVHRTSKLLRVRELRLRGVRVIEISLYMENLLQHISQYWSQL